MAWNIPTAITCSYSLSCRETVKSVTQIGNRDRAWRQDADKSASSIKTTSDCGDLLESKAKTWRFLVISPRDNQHPLTYYSEWGNTHFPSLCTWHHTRNFYSHWQQWRFVKLFRGKKIHPKQLQEYNVNKNSLLIQHVWLAERAHRIHVVVKLH